MKKNIFLGVYEDTCNIIKTLLTFDDLQKHAEKLVASDFSHAHGTNRKNLNCCLQADRRWFMES